MKVKTREGSSPSGGIGFSRMALVREGFYQLTGDFYLALVLNQFSHYQMMARGVDDYIEQENARSNINGIDEGYIRTTEGWFYKSAEELCEELMNPFKRTKAQELMQRLVDKGWCESRTNPTMKWDRVRQYRLDLVKIHRDLQELGFALPRWDTSKFAPAPPKTDGVPVFIRPDLPQPPDGNALPLSGIQKPGHDVVKTAERYTIPQETPKGTCREESNPKDLSKERFFQSSSSKKEPEAVDPAKGPVDFAVAKKTPDVDFEPGDDEDFDDNEASPSMGAGFPDSRSAEFPKLRNSNRADWCAGLKLFAPEISQNLASVLPGAEEVSRFPRLARKVYRRLTDGDLTLSNSELLARFYRKARYEGEGPCPWRVKTLDALMRCSVLPQAIVACREAASEELDELNYIIKTVSSLELDAQEFEQCRAYVTNYPNDDCCITGFNRAFLAIVSAHLKQDYAKIRDYDPAKLREDISKTLNISVFIGNLDPKEVLGYSMDEIKAIRAGYMEPIEAEINELEALLKA